MNSLVLQSITMSNTQSISNSDEFVSLIVCALICLFPMHILFLFCPKNVRRYRSQICVFIEKRDRDRKINRETDKDRKLNCDREAERD